MKMTREEVYKLVDTEREYQNNLPSSRTDYSDKSVGEYLTMLASYLQQAQNAWTFNNSDAPALEVVRKIAGIAVHCMEDHGSTPRVY